MRLYYKDRVTSIFWASGLLIVCGLVLLPFYKHQLNPDAVSYFGIANKYTHGDFRHAINGYWGPLLSWLLALLGLVIKNQIIAAKLIALISSVSILFILDKIAGDFKVSDKRRLLLYLPLVPVLLDWSLLQPISGDLLFAAGVCLIAWRGLSYLRTPTRARAVWFGVAGAVLYFTKPFGFFFALTVYGLSALLIWRMPSLLKKSGHQPFKLLAVSLAVFLAISAPWVLLLSVKYHHPTVATSTLLNHALVGPNAPTNPLLTSILPPANPTAVSSWEDPSHYVIQDWSIFGSFYNFYFSIGLVLSNIYAALINFDIVSIFGASIFILLLVYRLVDIQRHRWQLELHDFVLLIAVALILAYSPILILERYIYASMLLVGLAALLITSDRQFKLPKNFVRIPTLVLLLVLTSTTFYPLVVNIHASKDVGLSYAIEASLIKPYIPVNSAISSNISDSLFTCYYDNFHCYGVVSSVGDKKQDATQYQYLKQLGVGYFINYASFSNSPGLDNFIKKYTVQQKKVLVIVPHKGAYYVTIYKYKS
jgi:hypothetical protein